MARGRLHTISIPTPHMQVMAKALTLYSDTLGEAVLPSVPGDGIAEARMKSDLECAEQLLKAVNLELEGME